MQLSWLARAVNFALGVAILAVELLADTVNNLLVILAACLIGVVSVDHLLDLWARWPREPRGDDTDAE